MNQKLEQLPLGKNTKRDFKNNDRVRPEWLFTFENKHQDVVYLVPFIQPDTTFRSYCPVTGQPDSASIEIIYVPNVKMVESKSLKEYLQSFCNTGIGEFHEDCINRITKDLFDLMRPKYLRVFGDFVARGDLAIKPIVEIWGNYNIDQKERIERLVRMWDMKK